MFKVVAQYLKQNLIVICAALIVGTVSFLPQILAAQGIKKDYRGIPFIYQANEDAYLARIHDVVDGHPAVGSAFFYEYKSWQPVVPAIEEVLYAIPSIVFGVSVTSVVQASKFVLPALLFLLVYYLMLSLSSNPETASSRINALAGGLLVTLGYDLIDYRYIIQLFQSPQSVGSLLVWTRPLNPISGALCIFAFLLLVVNIIQNRKRILVLPAALVWALTIGYVFSWTFILVFLGLLTAYFVYKKDYWLVKQFAVIFLIWLLFTSPYWWQILQMFLTPSGGQALGKSGLVYMRTPVINKLLLMATICFAAASVFFKKYKKQEEKNALWWWLSLILVLTCWVVFNQQIITGRSIWYHHYVQYTIPTLMIIAMVILNNWVKPRWGRLWVVLVVLIIAAVFGLNLKFLSTIKYQLSGFKHLQTIAPVFSWLQKNAPLDCVVLNQDVPYFKIDTLIPAFTQCNVYTPTWVFDGVPAERILHNYLVMLRLREVKASDIESYLENHDTEVREYFFSNWDQLFSQSGQEYFAKIKQQLAADYKEFLKKDFSTELSKYKIDFILLNNDSKEAVILLLPNLKAVYQDSNYTLFKF